ncbi:hypothetical protein [Photorhabdus luminescens]|uniref:Uncharacterized protein n=1 Tax=Photorhabdus luminescens subsp. mexicana TaxID=2100167 RepID=A0A4R4J1S8_PHOLU|nr:hypothetical protein [Photorhabdus luminescens]TDB47374.1 hypothetical protein C5468_19320 [Photorhabdus luminescens subsp. mexicana]
MKKADDVQLIRGGKGKGACPAGKLCLYTHVSYNQEDTDGNILAIGPDIQLDEAQLASYGFIVGGRHGVSGVVNKMSKAGTLVSGLHINGETLRVEAGTDFPDLTKHTFPGGGTWNDATRSVVSAPVERVTLIIMLENGISLAIDQTIETQLKIKNESAVAVNGATIDFVSGDPAKVSVGNFNRTVNIPANDTVTVKIPLTGHSKGSTTLTAHLHTPLGIINHGDNVKKTNANVTERSVTIRMLMARQMEITGGVLSYAPLDIRNESNIEIAGVVLEPVSGNTTVLTVGEFNTTVTLPAADTLRVNIPVTGVNAGTALLATSLTLPPGIINAGDSQIQSQVTVVTVRDLNVDQKLLGHWQKVWDQPEWIYNYELTLKSESLRVVKWRLTFLLQKGAVLDPDWLETQKDWLEVDGETEGFIALINKTGHTIDPGVELKLAVQLLYPGKADEYNELYNLRLRQEL